VHDERLKTTGALFHGGYDWRHFHEVGASTYDVDDLNHYSRDPVGNSQYPDASGY